jgi:hypothetical protein
MRQPECPVWATLRGAVGPGSMGCPGAQGRTHSTHRHSKEGQQWGRRYRSQANAPGRGGATGRGRSRLRRKRPRGPPSRGRSSRAALARTFAGLRRYIDSEDAGSTPLAAPWPMTDPPEPPATALRPVQTGERPRPWWRPRAFALPGTPALEGAPKVRQPLRRRTAAWSAGRMWRPAGRPHPSHVRYRFRA